MNKNLTWDDFTIEPVGDQGHWYYSCIMGDGKEVAIEPCAAGYDIAVYDIDRQNDGFGRPLIGEKSCVGSTNRDEVVALASGLYAQIIEDETEDGKHPYLGSLKS